MPVLAASSSSARTISASLFILLVILLAACLMTPAFAAAINDGFEGSEDCFQAPRQLKPYNRSQLAPQWQQPADEYRDWQQRSDEEEDEFLFWVDPGDESEWEDEWDEESAPANPLNAEFI